MTTETVPMPESETRLQPESKTFNHETLTLLLHIDKTKFDLGNLPEMAKHNGFEEKSEFHITVLGFKAGKEIIRVLKKLPEQQKKDKISAIESIIESTDWSYLPKPEKYHVTKNYPAKDDNQPAEQRKSYIHIIDLPGMDDFYRKLNDLLDTSIEIQPAHITLFTNGNIEENAKRGIGISSYNELEQLNTQSIN